MNTRTSRKTWLIALASFLVCLASLFPFYWAIVTSLRSGSELFRPDLLPSRLNLKNYLQVFTAESFLQNLANSVIVAVGTVLASTFLALSAAYGLARHEFQGKRWLLYSFLLVSMFPQIAVLSGLFELIRALGLFNSKTGLGLTYMLFTLPFTVWTLFVFMREVPKEIEEAAWLDGASAFSLVFRIFIPMLAPSLVTTGLLAFIAAWNEFLFALTFTLTENSRTVPVAISLMSGASEHEIPWGLIMAASVTVTVPVIALILLFQKRIVAGLTAGSVKG